MSPKIPISLRRSLLSPKIPSFLICFKIVYILFVSIFAFIIFLLAGCFRK